MTSLQQGASQPPGSDQPVLPPPAAPVTVAAPRGTPEEFRAHASDRLDRQIEAARQQKAVGRRSLGIVALVIALGVTVWLVLTR
ncbi:MAG: hypothetical protein ABI652_07535 [Acidobacteriota bacterium]